VGKPEGKRPHRRPGRKWKYNIKMYLHEVGWMEWTGLTWLRTGTGDVVPVNAVMNLLVPSNAGKFLASLEPVSFSRRTLLHSVS
jgi:hypothetical protein